MSNDVEIKTTEVKKESLQKSLDSITAAQNDLGEKAKDTAKYFVNKGNQTIKKLHHEKPIVVLPSADSIDLYVSEYKFTE